MKQLILSGGGNAQDSKPLDKLLINLLPSGKKLLYLPIAWKSGKFESCRKWFKATFSNLGFNDFVMWTDISNKSYSDLESFGGIYLGGGNTYSLLNDLRKTGFDELLKKFIKSGRLVYGGSAGAIILGKNIETASFGEDADENFVHLKDKSGFNLVSGYTIQCHYKKSQDKEIRDFVAKTHLPVIALSEKTGLYVRGRHIEIIGFKSAYVFRDGEKIAYKPSRKLK